MFIYKINIQWIIVISQMWDEWERKRRRTESGSVVREKKEQISFIFSARMWDYGINEFPLRFSLQRATKEHVTQGLHRT